MDAESNLTYEQFLEAVRILAQPSWTDIVTALAAVGIGLLQTGLIAWGLWQMRVSSRERNRQLDAIAETQRVQMETLTLHTRALERLLARQER